MKVLHKDSCITCKRTILELKKMHVNLEVRDFFKEPLSEAELKKIISDAGISPRNMLRKRDKTYRKLNLEDSKKTDAQIVRLLAENPGLIKRPIIISENKVTVGRTDLSQL